MAVIAVDPWMEVKLTLSLRLQRA